MSDSETNRDDPERFNGLSKEDWARLKAERDYEGIFKSLGPDWTIHIERLRPTWCDGWCETISHDPEEPIDLDYIREQWGGSRFKLRIKDTFNRYVTALYVKIDADPRRHGKRIPHPEEVEHERRQRERELELAAMRSAPPAAPVQTQPAIDPAVAQILSDSLKSLASSKDGQIEYLTNVAKDAMKNATKNNEHRDLKELLELGKMFKEYMSEWGYDQGGGNDDPWSNAALKFVDILDRRDKLDKRRGLPPRNATSGQQQQQRQIRIVKNLGNVTGQDTGHDRPVQGAQTRSAGEDLGAAPPGTEVQLSRKDLSRTLADMEPMDSVAVVMAAMAQMEPEKRLEVAQMMMGGYDPSEALEELEQLEEEEGDEDDDQETEAETAS